MANPYLDPDDGDIVIEGSGSQLAERLQRQD